MKINLKTRPLYFQWNTKRSLVPRPRPAFRRLQYGKVVESWAGPGNEVILNVQRLFRCRDDWYQWGGSGGSGLAPGLPQRVTWNEGVHQSITNCSLVPRLSRWVPTKSLGTRLHKLLWHIGVHQSITNCFRARCVKSVIGLKLVIISSGIPVCLLCTLLHIKTEVLSRNSSYWYMYSCVL